MLTIYDHIAANNRKTLLLLLLFPASLGILTIGASIIAFCLIGDPEFAAQFIAPHQNFLTEYGIPVNSISIYFLAGIFFIAGYLPFVIGLSLFWLAVSYFFGDKMMLGFSNAAPLEKNDNPQAYRAVENVAIAAGLPMPKVFVIDDTSLNAFATGRDPKHASVALTRGIMEKLSPLELEGVIAHEMAHIGNRDIRLNMLIITGINIFGFLAESIRSKMIFRTRDSDNQSKQKILLFAVMIALLIFNFIIAPLIQRAVFRSREFAADATGALITRNPRALADALQKISADATVEILDKQSTISVACIENPRKQPAFFQKMLATHPPVDERIRRLLAMSGETL